MKTNGFFRFSRVFTVLFVVGGLGILAPSCKKSNAAGGATQTLRKYFSSAAQYTLFNKALQRAGVDTLLGGSGSFTVFAVDDSGMIKCGYTSAAIDTVNGAQLRRTLLYQLVPGFITKNNLPQYYQEVPLVTADSGINAYLEDNTFGFFYNGIAVVDVDSGMTNGVIQQIQAMAVPPIGDLLTIITRTPSLSDYSFIINSSNNSAGSYLSNAGINSPITVYLPVNAAYAALGLDNVTAIQQSGGVINNYFWSYGAYFTNDFFGGSSMSGYYAGSIPINVWFTKDGYSFYPADYQSNSIDPAVRYRIDQANIVATNGVIHLIQPYSY